MIVHVFEVVVLAVLLSSVLTLALGTALAHWEDQ